MRTVSARLSIALRCAASLDCARSPLSPPTVMRFVCVSVFVVSLARLSVLLSLVVPLDAAAPLRRRPAQLPPSLPLGDSGMLAHMQWRQRTPDEATEAHATTTRSRRERGEAAQSAQHRPLIEWGGEGGSEGTRQHAVGTGGNRGGGGAEPGGEARMRRASHPDGADAQQPRPLGGGTAKESHDQLTINRMGGRWRMCTATSTSSTADLPSQTILRMSARNRSTIMQQNRRCMI